MVVLQQKKRVVSEKTVLKWIAENDRVHFVIKF